MDKINFQNGILVAKAKVTINGTVYEVEPEEYEGTTPLNAENLNQIQTNAENAVNTVQSNLNTTDQNIEDLTTYSTTEKVVGTWIDGKPIYRKVIDFGILPNSTNKEVQHNISNLQNFVKIDGIAIRNDNNFWQAIPLTYRSADTSYNTALTVTQSKVVITCDADRSMFNGYVILEYTKTTD